MTLGMPGSQGFPLGCTSDGVRFFVGSSAGQRVGRSGSERYFRMKIVVQNIHFISIVFVSTHKLPYSIDFKYFNVWLYIAVDAHVYIN